MIYFGYSLCGEMFFWGFGKWSNPWHVPICLGVVSTAQYQFVVVANLPVMYKPERTDYSQTKSTYSYESDVVTICPDQYLCGLYQSLFCVGAMFLECERLVIISTYTTVQLCFWLSHSSFRFCMGHLIDLIWSWAHNSAIVERELIIVEGTTSKETREFSYKEDNIYRPVNKRGNGQFTNDKWFPIQTSILLGDFQCHVWLPEGTDMHSQRYRHDTVSNIWKDRKLFAFLQD